MEEEGEQCHRSQKERLLLGEKIFTMVNCDDRLNRTNKRKMAIGFDTMEVNDNFIKISFHKMARAEVILV